MATSCSHTLALMGVFRATMPRASSIRCMIRGTTATGAGNGQHIAAGQEAHTRVEAFNDAQALVFGAKCGHHLLGGEKVHHFGACAVH